jgi:flavin reductase (DIM6/NTAB) family NADH-FMN oxidoreductase RutF
MSRSIAALFQRLTQGVYVVGVAHGAVRNAFTAAWVMQVSFDPLLLTLSINPHHSSYQLLKEGRAFSVNVLKKGQLDLAEHYGQPARADKLVETDWTTDRTGLPLLREALAWLECEFIKRTPRRRSRAGAGKSDWWQAVGFRSRAHVLSRNWLNGRRLRAISRRVR